MLVPFFGIIRIITTGGKVNLVSVIGIIGIIASRMVGIVFLISFSLQNRAGPGLHAVLGTMVKQVSWGWC